MRRVAAVDLWPSLIAAIRVRALILVPLVLMVLASGFDLRTREIPDAIPILTVATGVAAVLLGLWPLPVAMAVMGLMFGILVGLVAGLVFGFGGGDGKLVAALGVWLGPLGLLATLVWVAIAGGGLALMARYRGETTYAYAPAIAAGLSVQAFISYGLGPLLRMTN